MIERSAVQYDLYAIRYATAPHRVRRQNFLEPTDDPHDTPMPMDFFVWLAIGGGRHILIDTGSDEATCKARGYHFLRNPADGVKQLGVTPAAIDTVISTHLHWDHSGNVEKFPAARFLLQASEIAHATGPCMCHKLTRRPYSEQQSCDFVRLLYRDRLFFNDACSEVAPGIIARHVGGHSPGLQSVEVMTRRGKVIVASDAAHFYDNMLLGNPYPVITDVREYLDGLGELMRWAGGDAKRIIPGHDPAVLQHYPPVSKELENVAVRLDVNPSVS